MSGREGNDPMTGVGDAAGDMTGVGEAAGDLTGVGDAAGDPVAPGTAGETSCGHRGSQISGNKESSLQFF